MTNYRILLFITLSVCSLLFVAAFANSLFTIAANPIDQLRAHPMYVVYPSTDPNAAFPSGYSPSQIHTAYNLPWGGSGTIAIIDAYDAPTMFNDLGNFSAYYGLPLPSSANYEEHHMGSFLGSDNGWVLETALDVEWAHAIAPSAKILLVQARDDAVSHLLDAVNYARGRSDVVAVSMSWGRNEFSGQNSYDSSFTSASGAAFFASSGDSGAGVIWPSSSANVIAVGGTTLNLDGSGNVLSETGWSGSGGGISAYSSAPSYQATYGLSGSMRRVPDVSYDANPSTGFPVFISGSWYNGKIGGTSAGAPQWAAIQALGHTTSNGNFYQDAKLISYQSYFRDITTGSNGGFSAGIDYDFVTGLGSPTAVDFTPSGTPTTTISLLPAGQSALISISNGFSVIYTKTGNQQTDLIQNTLTKPAPWQRIDADSGTSVIVSGASNGSTSQERWVFNSNADAFTIPAGSSQTLYYYNLLSQKVNFTIVGGGTPPNPTLSYVTAPATASGTPQQTAANLQLSQLPAQTIWCLRGSAASPTNPIAGSSTERWLTPTATWTITSSNQISTPITYFHQYSATFTYQITGGGTPTAPTLTATSLGVTLTTPLPTSPSTSWLDAGSQYALSNPLPSSTSTERWSTLAATSGTINGAVSFSATFFHQFNVSAAYALIGGGKPTAPDFTYTSYGSPASTQLATAQQQLWADSGTPYSTPSQLIGSTASSERWQTSQAISGTVSSATTLAFTYYHQYQVTASHSTSDSSTPSASITLSGTQFGSSSYTLTLTTSAQTPWLDAGTGWSVNNLITSGTQRWDAASGTSGTVSGAITIAPSYYHQYQQTLSYSVVGSGSPTAPTLMSTQFGGSYTPTLTGSATGYWLDNGASWAVTNPLSGSGSVERWQTSQSASGTVSASGTIAFTYYHQFQITPYYTRSDSSSPTVTNVVSCTQFGGGLTATPTLGGSGGSAVWVDAGSSVTYTSPISGGAGERWQVASADSGTHTSIALVSSTQDAAVLYYHQYTVTFGYSDSDLSSITNAATVGSYYQFGSSSGTIAAGAAYGLTAPASDWVDAGTGKVSYQTYTSGTERWALSSSPDSKNVASSTTLSELGYYHQFLQILSYSVVGSGSPTAPTFTANKFGSSAGQVLTTTPIGYWFDNSASWTITNPLGTSTATERWSAPANSGTIKAATTLTFSYYHQFNVSAAYFLVGGGTPTAPPLSSVSFGNPTALTLTSSPQLFWADSNSQYSAPSQLGGSTATERWITSANSGLIQTAAALNLTYYREFLLNVTGAQVSTQWFNSSETAQTSVPGVFNRTSGTGQRVTSYAVDSGNSTSVSPTAGTVLISVLMDAPHQLQINSVTQYQVTLDSVSISMLNSITPPMISGDNYWYDAGTPVLAVLNGAGNRAAGAGERLTSYSVNGNPTTVSTLSPVEALNIASLLSPQAVSAAVTSQYQLTMASGSVRSTTAPSIAGDTGWYDTGTPVTVTYDYTWNAVPGQSRLNALSYTIGQGATTPLTRQGSGTFSVQVQLTHPESIGVSSVTQYLFSVTGGNNVGLSQSSPTGDSFYDSGTALSASTDNIWGLQGGNTRQNLLSYTFDGVVNSVVRVNSGIFTTPLFTFNSAHTLAFNSATQYQVTLDSTAARILFSITPPSISGDNYWYDAGTPLQVILNGVGNRVAGTGERLTSYSVNGASNSVSSSNPVEVLNAASLLSPQTVLAVVTSQYQLSTPSGSVQSISAPSLPGDTGWYDTGTAVTATYDYSWNVVGQSRLNAVGYAVGQGATTPLARSSSGVFSVQVVMAHPESIAVSSVTQYSFSVSGGNNVVLSQASPTSDSFYDSGTILSVTSDNVWGIQGGNTRQNLISYILDGATTSVARADTGTSTTHAFTFDRAHVLTFNSATQYLIGFQFTDSSGTAAITPSSFQIDITSSGVADVPQFSLWLDSGTQIQIYSIIWQSVDVKPAGQTNYTANFPLNETIQCRIFNAQIRALDDQGNPVAGAQVTVTLANQTTISGFTDANGTLSLPMIPLGTFTATITYSGVTTTVTGDASGQAVTTAVISPPPTPSLSPSPSPSPSSTTLPVIPEMTPPAAVIAVIAVALAIALAIRKRSPPKP